MPRKNLEIICKDGYKDLVEASTNRRRRCWRQAKLNPREVSLSLSKESVRHLAEGEKPFMELLIYIYFWTPARKRDVEGNIFIRLSAQRGFI